MTHYIYDKDWLEKVNSMICPECRNTLTKKGIRKLCTSCSFEIKGNPQSIAYRMKTHKIIVTRKHTRICPDCFSTPEYHEYYSKFDEKVCWICGLVLEGPPHNIRDNVWVNYPFGIRLQWDIDILVEEIPLNMPDRTVKEFLAGYAGNLIKGVRMSYRLF